MLTVMSLDELHEKTESDIKAADAMKKNLKALFTGGSP
jgi:hypothetical protein